MKNVKIKKETWRELCQIKSKRNLSNLPKVIEYLINSQHVLKGENLQEIHRHVDVLIKAKNLEEKITEKQSGIELQCQQCGSTPFKLEEVVCDEFGTICPFCGYFHSLIIVQEDAEE